MSNPYNLPFEEAIAFFREKVAIPGADWTNILDGMNNWAFFVSQVSNAQLLQDIRNEVFRFIELGATFEEFAQNFSQVTEKHGWSAPEGNARRALIVADANLRTSQAAGRYQQMLDPDVLKQRPYWEYRHRDSPQFRPHHKILDGRIFSAEEVQKNSALAVPSGYGCRCLLISRRSLPPGKSQPDPVPKVNGKVAVMVDGTIREIADKGWNYMPGNKKDIKKELLNKLDPDLRKNII